MKKNTSKKPWLSEKEKSKLIFTAVIAFSVVALDQIAKLLAVNFIELGESFAVIKNIFHLTIVHNYGAAFGIFQHTVPVLIWISVIAIGFIIYYYDRIPFKKSVILFISLLIGGTISNLIDRIRAGYVIDFIDFRVWPAFNIADAAITIGAVCLAVYLLRKKQ